MGCSWGDQNLRDSCSTSSDARLPTAEIGETEAAAKQALIELTKGIGQLTIDNVSDVNKGKLKEHVETVKRYIRDLEAKVNKLEKEKRNLEENERKFKLYNTQWFHMTIGTSTKQVYEEAVCSVLSEVSTIIPEVSGWEPYVEKTIKVTCFQLTNSQVLDRRFHTFTYVLPYVSDLLLSCPKDNLLENFLVVGPLPQKANENPEGYNYLKGVLNEWYHDEQKSLEISQWTDPKDLLERPVRQVLDRARSDSTEADLKAMIKHAFHITTGRFLARLLSLDNIGCNEGYKENRKHLIVLATFAALLCLLLACYGRRFRVELVIPNDL